MILKALRRCFSSNRVIQRTRSNPLSGPRERRIDVRHQITLPHPPDTPPTKLPGRQLTAADQLPLRLKQHFQSAEKVAAALESDPRVAYVTFPGLASHPQHELSRRQFEGRGFGAMLAFAVEGDPETQNRFVNNLRVITSAVSLGHDETLIVHACR